MGADEQIDVVAMPQQRVWIRGVGERQTFEDHRTHIHGVQAVEHIADDRAVLLKTGALEHAPRANRGGVLRRDRQPVTHRGGEHERRVRLHGL